MGTVEYIELFWDCPHCGEHHISAIFNSQGNRCPKCLHWRTEDIELYEAPNSQVITDPHLINRKPFWVCKSCDAVNEDTGLPANLLQCSNCDSYQTSEVGGITGNLESDRQAPNTVAVGNPVERREHLQSSQPSSSAQTPVQTPSQTQKPKKSRISRLTTILTWINLVGGGTLASLMWASYITHNPSLLQVQVMNLQWNVEVDVQEQQTYVRQSWQSAMPAEASVVQSERRQRGTRQEQQGSRTVMVQQQYQSGTRIETYTEPEQYQSGTRTESYTESERYQSGTRTETYTESERYQSGTREECRTTSRGNGIGERRCHQVPEYSTRQTHRTRTVPVYSTRQVQRTRTVPVYSTRQVQRTRTVPVYSTRQVPTQQPIMVTVPVYENWVTYRVKEWVPKQTYVQTGYDDMPRRSPAVNLTQQPPQRIAATRTSCYLDGSYSVREEWFQAPESRVGKWMLPCEDYDRVDVGDQIQLRLGESNAVNLVL
jgi:hypothetical protein